MRATNLTLLTDLYELTMMQGYFKNPTNQTVIFDMFYRVNPCGGSFAITAGLEQMIEYIENLHFSPEDIDYLRSLHIFEEDFLEYLSGFHFTGDIYAIPEGTVVFPREPLGAKPLRRYELLGGISLLSPEYLLSFERCPFHTETPDHYALVSYLIDLLVSQSSALMPLHSNGGYQSP